MKILFVCLGNICRSPLAEGIMRQLCAEQNLDWQIASAGTGSWHVGEPPHKGSIDIASEYGYDISKQKAQHFNKKMFEAYDYIFVMDRNNLLDVLQMADTEVHKNKVQLFLNDNEVIDPYFDHNLFNAVCLQIEQRCKELISEL